MKAGKLHHVYGMITTSICASQNTLVVRVRPSAHFHTLIVTLFVGAEIISSPHQSRNALGPTQPPVKRVPSFFPGSKVSGAWRFPPNSI